MRKSGVVRQHGQRIGNKRCFGVSVAFSIGAEPIGKTLLEKTIGLRCVGIGAQVVAKSYMPPEFWIARCTYVKMMRGQPARLSESVASLNPSLPLITVSELRELADHKRKVGFGRNHHVNVDYGLCS